MLPVSPVEILADKKNRGVGVVQLFWEGQLTERWSDKLMCSQSNNEDNDFSEAFYEQHAKRYATVAHEFLQWERESLFYRIYHKKR